MKKLDEIPKNNPFKVPDGYFERLPGVIQARVAAPQQNPEWSFWAKSLRYALPVVLMMMIGIFWYRSENSGLSISEIELQLGKIHPDQLASYLEDRDITTEELMENTTWSTDDLDELESSVYSALDVSNSDLEKIINESDDL